MHDHGILSAFTERFFFMNSSNQKQSIASKDKRELCSNKYLRFIFPLNYIFKKDFCFYL